MAITDKIIGAISPKWAFQRAQYRTALNSVNGGTPTRLSEQWQQAQGFRLGTTAEAQNVQNERSRAFQAFDKNPVARSLVEIECNNVIGDSLNYQPTSSRPEWNKEAKDKYWEWFEDCSVRGADIETGCEVQQQAWMRSRVAGDIAWVLVSRGLESKIQLVSPENIVTPDGRYSDPNIRDGIKFDTYGKPVEFYLLSQDERSAKRTFTTIAARDIVYLPHTTKPNQARPPSCYTTIFDLLAHLDRYVDGVSLAAWMATVFGIVFKQNNASKQLNQLATLTNSQGVQQKAVTFENGMVKYVGTDEDVAQVQAQQPMQQTPEFIRSMYRMLGQPFHMPLEVLALDMSTCNFASARIGLLPFYRQCRIKAARFGSRWSRTIRWWLSREAQRPQGDLKKWKTAFPPDYWNHLLLPNEWDYTDPVSEVQSDLLQIDAGFKSHAMVMNERGRDLELITEQEREYRAANEENIVHSTMTRDPAPEPVEPTSDPNQQDNTDVNN